MSAQYLIDVAPWHCFGSAGEADIDGGRGDRFFWHHSGVRIPWLFDDGFARSYPIDAVEIDPYFASEATL